MDLQNVFYIVGIVAMVLFIVFTVLAIAFLLFVRKLIADTHHAVVGKIIEYTRPVDVFKGLAGSVAGNLFIKLKENFGLK